MRKKNFKKSACAVLTAALCMSMTAGAAIAADAGQATPELSIEKTASASTASAGDEVTFTITVAQTTEGATAENVVISDPLPEGLELEDAWLGGVGGTVIWPSNTVDSQEETTDAENPDADGDDDEDAGEGADGSEGTDDADEGGTSEEDAGAAAIEAAVGDVFCIEVPLGAEVSYPGPILAEEAKQDEENGTATWSFTAESEGEYTITASYEDEDGDPVTEEFIVNILSAEGTGDDVDNGDDAATDTYENATVNAEIPEMVYGETAVLTIVALVTDGSELSNTATAAADNADAVSDTAVINSESSGLAVSKTTEKSEYAADEDIVYTISVAGASEGVEDTGVIVTDLLPEELVLVGVEASGLEGDITIDGNSVTAEYGSIAYGDEAVITVTANAAEGVEEVSVINTAEAVSEGHEAVSDSAEVYVLPAEDPETEDTDSIDGSIEDDGTTSIEAVQTGDSALPAACAIAGTAAALGAAVVFRGRKRA